MAETNFTLHSTDTNNYKLQKTFTGVNPDVTSAELVETAQGFNRLTDNTYVGTKRIVKYDADSEESGNKPVPTLTVGDFESLSGNGYRAAYTYDGDGVICVNISGGLAAPYTNTSDQYVFLSPHNTTAGSTFTVTITATATDNYAAPVTVTKTITWEG